MRQADCLPLLLKLPQPFTEPRLLPVYRADFLQQPTVGIVEALHNRRQYAHIIAQAANLARQPLQGLSDIGVVDERLASVVAQYAISFRRTPQTI
jgi:hypothetical protein